MFQISTTLLPCNMPHGFDYSAQEIVCVFGFFLFENKNKTKRTPSDTICIWGGVLQPIWHTYVLKTTELVRVFETFINLFQCSEHIFCSEITPAVFFLILIEFCKKLRAKKCYAENFELFICVKHMRISWVHRNGVTQFVSTAYFNVYVEQCNRVSCYTCEQRCYTHILGAAHAYLFVCIKSMYYTIMKLVQSMVSSVFAPLT